MEVLLYIAAVCEETVLGIWMFGNMFPKRNKMGKKHRISEWILFSSMAFCGYIFVKYCYHIEINYKYIINLIVIYMGILCGYIFWKCYKKIWTGEESQIVKVILFMGCVSLITMRYWASYQPGLMILLGNIFPVFFLFSFYNCSLFQAYLWQFLYLVGMGMLKAVYIVYAGTFQNKDFEAFIYFPREHTYGEAVYLIIVYTVLWVIMKNIPIKNVFKYIFQTYEKTVFFVTFSVYWILAGLMSFGTGKIREGNLTITLSIVVGTIIGLMIIFIRYFEKNMEMEKHSLDVRNEAIEKQYQELNQSYERYRCLVHDEKNMIYYLETCLENGKIEEAKRCLQSRQRYIVSQGKCTLTGIPTLDFMLNIKKKKMADLNVKFQIEVNFDIIPMEDADFVVVLGNLLDNAIEAVEKCPITNRKICLRIKSINQMFGMEIKNTYMTEPTIIQKRFITNKSQKENHGWGIESVRHVIEKYEGEITFSYEEDYFVVFILLNE